MTYPALQLGVQVAFLKQPTLPGEAPPPQKKNEPKTFSRQNQLTNDVLLRSYGPWFTAWQSVQ
jgi:hypothetical protein